MFSPTPPIKNSARPTELVYSISDDSQIVIADPEVDIFSASRPVTSLTFNRE